MSINAPAAGRYVLHVRPEIKPASVVPMLAAIRDGKGLEDIAGDTGLATNESQNQALAELRRLGLVETRAVGLTDRGRALLALASDRPHLVAEAVHAIYQRLPIETSDGSRIGAGWSYAQACASAWASGSGAFDRAGIIGRVVAGAAEEFGLDEGRIAFSPKSVTGITNWLAALEPQVYSRSGSSATITLRHVCPPEAVWWAVDALHHAGGRRTPPGARLPLSDDRAEVLCQRLLVHPDSLDRVLSQAKRRSDYSQGGIFDTGTTGGMGRWVLLAREVVPPAPGDG